MKRRSGFAGGRCCTISIVMNEKKDVIIIGAGASGLMCAIAAGKRRRSVLILDHACKTASKIRVSGGGRCNFTNLLIDPSHYISRNPHFCKSALAGFTPDHFIALLDKHGISYKEKEKGQLFCTGRSQEIVEMLHGECREAGVEIRLHQAVRKIVRKDRFLASTDSMESESDSLIIATGGLSYPQLGATNFGYKTARQFGIAVTPLRPALVPFTFGMEDLSCFRELSGVSINAFVSCGKAGFQGEVLFTHQGMSGPAILQMSCYLREGETVTFDLLPGTDLVGLFTRESHRKIELNTLLSRYLPKRFARAFCDRYVPSGPLCHYSTRELTEIARRIHNWSVTPSGTAGYGKAEVTLGGVDTDELSSKTMESKKVPGLYFTGEVIDVTGQLGGYNLHWAWASGHAAGQYA